MVEVSYLPRHTGSRKILTVGREHWDLDGYDENARHAFLRAVQCKTPALGARRYGSEHEEWDFCNTCKVGAACTTCGNWRTTRWQQDRDWALPNIRYLAITFTMPDSLWQIFKANPLLRRKLEIIASRVVMSYARVRKGVEVGTLAIQQTFNGKLEFNPHVHMLVTAGDLLTTLSGKSASIYFDGEELTRSWQRLIIGLLRRGLRARGARLLMSREELERLLQTERQRTWHKTNIKPEIKEHFLGYGGRYCRRPPITERRILDVTEEFVKFWYFNKRIKRREIIVCSIKEFIDRWAQHIPKRYDHTVRYFGRLAHRHWAKVRVAVLSDQCPRSRPKPLSWAGSIKGMGKPNPLLDSKGRPMRYVRHVAPLGNRTVTKASTVEQRQAGAPSH